MPPPLTHAFQPYLPSNITFDVLHVQSHPYECKNLLIYPHASPQNSKPSLTLKIKHLLLLIDKSSHLVVLGIEVYVYLTFFPTSNHIDHHIFVSKADTTGLASSSLKVGDVIAQFLQFIINANPSIYFHHPHLKSHSKQQGPSQNLPQTQSNSESPTVTSLHKIIHRLRTDPNYYKSIPLTYKSTNSTNAQAPFPSSSKLSFPQNENTSFTCSTKLSLFTRSANEYLFPLSHQNPHKHLIDGSKLFAWWIRIIDQISQPHWHNKIIIPGSDHKSTHKYIVDMQNKSSGAKLNDWEVGSLFTSDDPKNLAIHVVPVFPDDPKGRFLEHLVVENRYKTVNVSHFWEELGFRQEFRLGNVVGIIGCDVDNRTCHQVSTSSVLSSDTRLVSHKIYKKLVDIIKGQDFSIKQDIESLVTNDIVHTLKNLTSNPYASVVGTKAVSNSNYKAGGVKRINQLSSSIVKRKKTTKPANDLTGAVLERNYKLTAVESTPVQSPSVNTLSSSLIKRKSKK